MAPDRRLHPREALRLPFKLIDGSAAMTRDISAQGMYFITTPHAQLERWVTLEYALPESGLRFSAAGEVVRVEARSDWTGVAMRLHAPSLQASD